MARRVQTPMAERTRLATAGAHAAVVRNLDKQPRGDVWRGKIFFALLLIAVVLALLGLVALIVQSAIKGQPAFSARTSSPRAPPQ